MNILVTAIGSMSAAAVIDSLKNASHIVFGCDIYPAAWVYNAGGVGHFQQAPRCDTPDAYLDFICHYCETNRIDFVIPLTDPEVDLLSARRHLLPAGTQVALAEDETLINCRDKLRWFNLLNDLPNVNRIPTVLPEEYVPGLFPFPLMIKPRNGRSSEGVFRAESEADIAWYLTTRRAENVIIQPLLSGDVYVVDIVRDAQGQTSAVARKELLRTANGAGLTVEMTDSDALLTCAIEIAHRLKTQGCINIEFIKNRDEFYVMDINPRFSAGVEFSMMAGYDMAINHLHCFTHQTLHPAISCQPAIFTRHYVADVQR